MTAAASERRSIPRDWEANTDVVNPGRAAESQHSMPPLPANFSTGPDLKQPIEPVPAKRRASG